ncbi:hypothetical protein I545_3743 [Mycobacterium kansasii 662]|uniref:Uncharacterized protein n=2 Tax=Mycobacterium kansasii TaxID=1768 RepID=A0A1V3XET5_MYCKA|nr:hypothetical protein I547_5472 [Mycobacterium kansasii 824]EUA16856.1 hypothetical protein I545_3743 [Mycobacterium kansasii 662]KEP41759.1 hypothetical protein MKSMC1_31240 [Mycobacterium kansasii]OOK77618.1 hypothetical protein BZL29_3737 [Mycobacterium kansasii]
MSSAQQTPAQTLGKVGVETRQDLLTTAFRLPRSLAGSRPPSS